MSSDPLGPTGGAPLMSDPEVTVDIRFTSEGVSASMYDADANVLDEAWYTWAEVGGMKADDRSHITFEYDYPDGPDVPPRVTDIDQVMIKTADIEVSADVYEAVWTKDWQDSSNVEMLIDPVGTPDWMEDLLES